MASQIDPRRAGLLTFVRRGTVAAVSEDELAELRGEGLIEQDAFRLTLDGSRSLRKYTENEASEQLGAVIVLIIAIVVVLASVVWWLVSFQSSIPGTIFSTMLAVISVRIAIWSYKEIDES